MGEREGGGHKTGKRHVKKTKHYLSFVGLQIYQFLIGLFNFLHIIVIFKGSRSLYGNWEYTTIKRLLSHPLKSLSF